MKVEWRGHLTVDNGEIDRQHQELFAAYNAFLQACEDGLGSEEVYTLLVFLGDYVQTHFADEEKAQLESGFPGYRQHREEHQWFMGELETLKGEFAVRGPVAPLVAKTGRIVSGWLIQHIAKMDGEFGRHLGAAGRSSA